MRAHVLVDSFIVNTIEVESLDVLPNLIDASLGGEIGDQWDGHQFLHPAPIVVIPMSVTMSQFRLALLGKNLLDTVTTAIMRPGFDRTVQIKWQYDLVVQRQGVVTSTIQDITSYDDPQTDILFLAADKL